VIEDAALEPGALRDLAGGLLADPDRLGEMAEASAGLARPDAAERVAGEILDAIRRADG
jgi:UDP-N-acetylglucosamine--N-acetylmuramyl-(pentapeptide) pyrophosphoryl-undecaprenol N-acetylglucosamine transferase